MMGKHMQVYMGAKHATHRLNSDKLFIIKSMMLPYKSLISISKWYPYVYLHGNILFNGTPVLFVGIESLPLVERLFADLLHTTEGLKNSKLSAVLHITGSYFVFSYVYRKPSSLFMDNYMYIGLLQNGQCNIFLKQYETLCYITCIFDILQNDNGRLVKENNDLHMQLIRAKEDADKRIAGFVLSYCSLTDSMQPKLYPVRKMVDWN